MYAPLKVYSDAVVFSWDKPEFFGAPIEYYKVLCDAMPSLSLSH
jgi:hypothetical protein